MHATSVVHTDTLRRWLAEREKLIDDANLWISAGSPKHWRWSVEYAFKYERGFTYWGSHLDAEELKGIFKVVRGVVGSSAKLFESSTLEFVSEIGAKVPHIILFYVSGIGIIGAGIVTQLEFDFLNLFWPEEKDKGRVVFPFRYKMKIIWLVPSVIENPSNEKLWKGDEELTDVLKAHAISGLQPVKKSEVVLKVKDLLKKRVKEFDETIFSKPVSVPITPAMPTGRLEDLTVEKLRKIVEARNLAFKEDVLVQVVSALKSGKHLLLMGPPGTGKTTLAKIIAEAMGFEPYICTCLLYTSPSPRD